MSSHSFQIRVCQNPTCGLRFPLVEGQSTALGERCPVCLGPTVSVIEHELERESAGENHVVVPDANLQVLLDNIRSAWNVGSIFRAADGFGFRCAYLCGITPSPDSSEVRKTALGAEGFVQWSYHRNAVDLVRDLRRRDHAILALEQARGSISIELALAAFRARPVIVLVVGNEVTGVDPGVLEIADCICHIPLRGQKRSLNAAVAFAVAAQILSSRY